MYIHLYKCMVSFQTTAKDVPVLLVGGGSVLVDTKNWIFKGVSSIKRTPHFDVCMLTVQCSNV